MTMSMSSWIFHHFLRFLWHFTIVTNKSSIRFCHFRVIVARLDGTIDFLELETFVNINCPAPPLPSHYLNHRGKYFFACYITSDFFRVLKNFCHSSWYWAVLLIECHCYLLSKIGFKMWPQLCYCLGNSNWIPDEYQYSVFIYYLNFWSIYSDSFQYHVYQEFCICSVIHAI